jgi:pimeloyl-ACP methyl ester carboxylesterase
MHLFYRVYGDGFPLLILHGLFGSSGNWHTLASKAFSPYFRVFTLDLRNHGQSPHDARLDYPAMADDVRVFMDAQGLEQAHVLGHSMGGKTAMQLALTWPERVDHLVVADIAPRAYPPRHDHLLAALASVDLSAMPNRTAVEDVLARQIPETGVRQFLLKNLEYQPAQGYRWKMNLAAIQAHYDRLNAAPDAAGVFDRPTCFLRGGRSDYIRTEDHPRILQFFPQAEVVTIPEAGHWIHADAPQIFAETVLRFLGVAGHT